MSIRHYAPLRLECVADPVTPMSGDFWYNSTDNVLRYYNGINVVDILSATSLDGIPVLADTPTSPSAGDVWYSEDDCGIQVFDGSCIKTITNGVTKQFISANTQVFVGAGDALMSLNGRGGLVVDGTVILCCDASITSVK